MRVFIPAPNDANPFLDEIIKKSTFQYTFGNYADDVTPYDIILINWPEQIFNWKAPSEDELKKFKKYFFKWKKSKKIGYIVHNLKPHIKGELAVYKDLYDFICLNSDVLLHLGDYSKKLYTQLYPNQKNVRIHHPLYVNSFPMIDKKEARKVLGISNTSSVILAPGKIRIKEERKLILDSFRKLKVTGKVLIVTNMRKLEDDIEFKGRYLLKSIIDVRRIIGWCNDLFYSRKQYKFSFNFLSSYELAIRFAACDVVLIPRVNTLNSGNLYLALTYGKVVVGPDVGNLATELDALKMPKFSPNNLNSVVESLLLGCASLEENNNSMLKKKRKYNPSTVAKKIEEIFSDLL